MAAGDTSFQELTVAELRAVAKMFDIHLGDITKKADIIKAIESTGATWELYEAFLEGETEEDVVVEEPVVTGPVEDEVVVDEVVIVDEPTVVVEPEADVVVRMTRENPSYQVRGYYFTEDHPYALVKESDADYLIEFEGGFRLASPREVREFYGA